jgi:puromycin-sensitive aminopeptidase
MSDTTATEGADPSARYRLPYSVEPRRYALRLTPDLDNATFTGEVHIEVLVHETVDEIVLHAAELTVDSAELERGGGTRLRVAIRLDEDTERLILTPPAPLEPGPAVISLEFAGVLNDKLHGFYRSEFTDDAGGTHVIATTQFEATDARRAFPCFDEPDRKAVFSVTLDVPDGLEAYSNGPEVEEVGLPGGGRRVRFGDTIAMSTYLVAFVVGPLEATDPVEVRGTPIRIVHAPGKGDLTAFALEAAAHSLEFFA